MADMDTYNDEQRGYEGNYDTTQGGYDGHNDRDYGRERSRSPGPDRDGEARIRDEPMNGRAERDHAPDKNGSSEDAVNPGSNLFVTGIHPRLSEDQIKELFSQYGVVEKCNIMRDPHTRESRGFGFVKMATPEDADHAKEKLQGEVYEGRTLSIEKARRARPRTPTPGKYFGPPKRDDRPPRGGYRDRYYEDRGYGRRDDRRGGGGGYRDRYDDRGYGGGRRDDYPRSDRDRFAYRGDDRYGGERGGERGAERGGERRGGGYGGGGYDRPPRGPPPEPATGAAYSGHPRDPPPPRDDYERRRGYD